MDLTRGNFKEEMVKGLFDLIALKFIDEKGTLAGYNFMKWIQEKYGILLSSGTVYSKLYRLEKNGLVEGRCDERKTTYILTKKGKETLNSILSEPTSEQFLTLLERPLSNEEVENIQ